VHPNTRKSIRWKGYDYAQKGAYYITICTDARRHWFGRIADAIMHRSPLGELAQRCWNEIPDHMPHVDLGEFIVMPNHVHGIVIIRERIGDDGRNAMPGGDGGNMEMPVDHDRDENMTVDHDRKMAIPVDHDRKMAIPVEHDRPLRPIVPVGSLGRIMRAYKSAVSRIAYRDGLVPHGTKIWQRNYWDRVIRDAPEYARITDYIRDNPAKWNRDRFNRRGS
jgi:putative transposase